MRNSLFVLLLLGLLVSPLAHAARTFPPKVEGGILTPLKYPYVKIGSNTFKFSAGGKIYDQANRIIQPVRLTSTVNVAYLIDMGGELSKLWILTDEEVKNLAKSKANEAKKPEPKAPNTFPGSNG